MSIWTKCVTYRNINPNYDVHLVYSSNDSLFMSEAYRISFTRLRLSSNNLRIETGRWSRIPRDRRLCLCGSVQDEEHVLVYCQVTQHLRDNHGIRVLFPDILHSKDRIDFKLIHETMNMFQWTKYKVYLLERVGNHTDRLAVIEDVEGCPADNLQRPRWWRLSVWGPSCVSRTNTRRFSCLVYIMFWYHLLFCHVTL